MINSELNPIFQEIEDINFNAPWIGHIPNTLKNKFNYYLADDKNLSDGLNDILFNLYPSGLTTGKSQPLLFVPQQELYEVNQHTPTAYETFIAETGKIPTRNNLHDLFNAWIWFTYPKTKAMLNCYQATNIDRDGVSKTRGRLRDAITIFDESGAIFITSDHKNAEALKSFDWQNVLISPRQHWDNPLNLHSTKDVNTAVYIFGHATLEQLVEPRKPICSHCKIVLVDEDFFKCSIADRMAYLDERLLVEISNWLENDQVTPRDLSPLPILGIPHFWEANINPKFYDDTFVFRSGRKNRA